jgi:hypothetical protein
MDKLFGGNEAVAGSHNFQGEVLPIFTIGGAALALY